ncbi:MAG TPA: hypothetical protein VII33_10305 [Nakamurella sp.]
MQVTKARSPATLRELLGHDTVRTALGYYKVTSKPDTVQICTEPTNVAAGGHSCLFRHRCTYFRSDPSYTPELHAYLAQLLAGRSCGRGEASS